MKKEDGHKYVHPVPELPWRKDKVRPIVADFKATTKRLVDRLEFMIQLIQKQLEREE